MFYIIYLHFDVVFSWINYLEKTILFILISNSEQR